MSRDRWGHWGEADERAALNLIGPEQVRAAAGLVRSGTVFSLAQSISARTPVPQHRAPPGHFMMRTGGDYAAGARRPGGFQFAEDALFLPLHFGTHIDSLCHVWYDDHLYNGHAQSSVRSTGAARCGVEKLPPIVTRGVPEASLWAGATPRSFAPGGSRRIRTRRRTLTPSLGSTSRPRNGWPNAASPSSARTTMPSK